MRCVTLEEKRRNLLFGVIAIKSLEMQIAGVAEVTDRRRSSTDARPTKGSKSWQMTGVARGLRGLYIAYVG